MSLRLPLRPTWVLAQVTFESTVRSWRGLGLALLSFFPAVVVAGLYLAGTRGEDLVMDYETLAVRLFLPLVLLLVSLMLAVPLFRDEIDEQSIGYLITRTVGKPAIVLGKYVGYVGLASLLLLPSCLVAYGLAAAGAGSEGGMLSGVLPALLVSTFLGILAYGAFYLFLGLATRRALLVGLVYAFLWEFLIGSLPGSAPDLSVMHYLLTIPRLWTTSGPLASYPSTLTLAQAVGVPLGVACALLLLTLATFWRLPLSPSPE